MDGVASTLLRNISDAKAELSNLIERALNGEEIIIAKAGKPVVRLVAYSGPAHPRKPGALKNRIRIAPDFDTLPPDIAEAFGAAEPTVPAHGTGL
ncbi:MAG: type II toxin-antitoxin system prevent-host-death family antitoxin [Bryobacteraceae bacterium]